MQNNYSTILYLHLKQKYIYNIISKINPPRGIQSDRYLVQENIESDKH